MRSRVHWSLSGYPSVLIYGNRKQDDLVWLFITPAQRRHAVRALFEFLDQSWDVYAELKRRAEDPQLQIPGIGRKTEFEQHREWYLAAKQGDEDAAWSLLNARKDYEYEQWRIYELQEE
jgi:hypothetical protein